MQYLKSAVLPLLMASSLIASFTQAARANRISSLSSRQHTVQAQASDPELPELEPSPEAPEPPVPPSPPAEEAEPSNDAEDDTDTSTEPSVEPPSQPEEQPEEQPEINEQVEIDDLPDSLFADPNPLSFPTVPEEIDIEANPVITLEQAVELAYRNSQALQAAQLSLEQAEAAVREAEAANLPSVSTTANLTDTRSDNQDSTVLDGNLSVGYDLLTGGARGASIRSAQLQQNIAALVLESQQAQIKLATANAYYALQEAGEQIRINQAFLDEAARNLRDARLRQEVGVGTRFDVLRADVQFANARQSLISSQGNQSIARRDIARLLNLPPTAGITATPVAVGETWPLTLEESILLAFENRAELEQQLLQADISEQQRQIALAALRPQVSLSASYSPNYTLSGGSPFADDFQDSVSFGVGANWLLFDGGAARASARQQEIGGAIAEEQFSENLDQVRFDVEQAFFNLQSNQENIATAKIAVAQAQEALDLANLRLQAGVGTQLEVLEAQSELNQSEFNEVAAILGYNRALAAIERAISNISVE